MYFYLWQFILLFAKHNNRNNFFISIVIYNLSFYKVVELGLA